MPTLPTSKYLINNKIAYIRPMPYTIFVILFKMLCKLIVRHKQNLNMKRLSIMWNSHISTFPNFILENIHKIGLDNRRLRYYTTCTEENRIVSDIRKEWVLRFEESGIPEPESSINLITDYVLKKYSEEVTTVAV